MNIDKMLNNMLGKNKLNTDIFSSNVWNMYPTHKQIKPDITRSKVTISKADGKDVIIKSTGNYPSVKMLDSIYKKIPDDRKVPVVLESRKQYLLEYIRNQEAAKKTKFSKEEKDRYLKSELEALKDVDARFTTYKNKFINPRVVIFPQRGKVSKARIEENVLHEFAHELEERNPSLTKEWKKKTNPKYSPTWYGMTDKSEDLAESYTMYKNPTIISVTNPNTNKAEIEKRFTIIRHHLGKERKVPTLVNSHNHKFSDVKNKISKKDVEILDYGNAELEIDVNPRKNIESWVPLGAAETKLKDIASKQGEKVTFADVTYRPNKVETIIRQQYPDTQGWRIKPIFKSEQPAEERSEEDIEEDIIEAKQITEKRLRGQSTHKLAYPYRVDIRKGQAYGGVVR